MEALPFRREGGTPGHIGRIPCAFLGRKGFRRLEILLFIGVSGLSKIDDTRRALAFEFIRCAGNVFVLVRVPFQGGLATENNLE